ncbi:uncharacterized protein ATNIH1004_001695 [Aspergillus tanneri]|uniref:Alpha/beta hydrolase fold-3 domain-containing protein n=1 Tax=Aspergillus tanneri TaxID=1220188 RepID=A0A5M9N505_9EURO|nr:uncharacterized protein ATNIH1004_001695 [Aspergillus tanneri]KAA8652790.1 hypothetical protein ATNIH1004_001695 [Aspergillus tanneri]
MNFEDSRHLIAATQKVRAEYLKSIHTIPISTQQATTNRNDPVKGPVWVSKFTNSKPTNDTSRDLLLSLIDEANDKNIPYDCPDSASLSFEWTGFRSNTNKDTPEPSLSEGEKFEKLIVETKSPLTIFYIYGGSFVLNTPSNYRKTAGLLAQSTGSKVLMVHQRLAPQNPFPAALLDVFQAYLTLLAPPPGSPHKAIPPSSIVLAGDSSGACLALGMLQVLLRLIRRDRSITFHGQNITPTVPAGAALVSAVADLANAFPSFNQNAFCDIFPVPIEKLPYLQKTFPTCASWPTNPPRANLYCEAGMLAHPLASPAASEDWTGACPIWIGSGQEQIIDASKLVVQTAHAQGVSVTIQEYEAMPHTFFFFFRQAPQTRKIMEDWAGAIVNFGKGKKPCSSASFIRVRGLVAEPMDVENLVPYTVAEAKEMMWKKTLGYKVPAFHRTSQSLL